jgi:hypothetical protein
MKIVPEKQIVQIMPAIDWYAVYFMVEEPWVLTQLIPAFALVRDEDGDTDVEGLEADNYMSFCSVTSNFHCYAHASQLEKQMPDWEAAAQRSAKKRG